VGLGFLLQAAYLLPLTVFSLALALAALGLRARRHRGYGPLGVGGVAAFVLLLGKFVVGSDVAVYAGVAGLVGASLWNAWSARPATGAPAAPTGALYQIGSIQWKEENMATKRQVEVFSAGCPACQEVVALVRGLACPSCDVSVLDMHDPAVARRAKGLGVRSVPAVVIDGKLADCCQGRGPDEAVLRAAGLGQAIP
jgi:hypothetical protein